MNGNEVTQAMRDLKLKVCYAFNENDLRGGGVAIVYAKTTPNTSNDMYEVSVAYCRQGDTFCKKTGLRLALERFLDGRTVVVKAKTKNHPWVDWNLKQMFFYSLDN